MEIIRGMAPNEPLEQVILRALVNEKTIIEQRREGRQFQVKDPRKGIATVRFA